MKYIKLTTSKKRALVDDKDFTTISKYTWYLGKSGYPETRTPQNEGKKLIRMHHLILPKRIELGLFVDHINMNGCDNRRKNLRYATKSQNMMNRKAPKFNTSGFKGVTWCAFTKKWRAQIWANKKHHCLGRYSTKKEAAKAYNKAAPHYHGDFKKLNVI